MLHDSQHRSMFTSIYFQRVHIYSTDFCAIVVPSSVNNINFNCFVVFSSLAILCTFRPVFHFHMMWLCVMCNDHNSTWRYATNSEIVHSKTSLFSLTLSWAWEMHTQIIPIVRIRRHHSYQPMEESCVKEWGERNTKLSFSYSGLNFAVSTPLFHSI